MSVEIRAETSADYEAIRDVNRQAFGGEDEARLVDALREGGYVEVSLVAVSNGRIVGHLLFSRVTVETHAESVAALSLAPVAVRPECQRQGIGSRLIEVGLETCRARGHRLVTLLGHPEFYPRFGFTAAWGRRLPSPFGGGEAWMALELVPGALDEVAGRVVFSPPFAAFE